MSDPNAPEVSNQTPIGEGRKSTSIPDALNPLIPLAPFPLQPHDRDVPSLPRKPRLTVTFDLPQSPRTEKRESQSQSKHKTSSVNNSRQSVSKSGTWTPPASHSAPNTTVDPESWDMFPRCSHLSTPKSAHASGGRQPLRVEKIIKHDYWALVIGIDKYESGLISSLQGCRADANDFAGYLIDTVGAPKGNVRILKDERATRRRIIDRLKEHFMENPKINTKSVVIFYFAGHGNRDSRRVSSPTGTTGSLLETVGTICSYDYGSCDLDDPVHGEKVYGIPQPTLHKLLHSVEQERGCNIVAIFDSCHAGGMSPSRNVLDGNAKSIVRTGNDGDANVRSAEGLDLPQILPADLDHDIVERLVKMVPLSEVHSPNSERSVGVTSHSYVVLAACREGQKAHEIRHGGGTYRQWRGLFTVALVLGLLRERQESKSYHEMVHDLRRRMQSLANHGQVPECRGADGFHRLFMHYGVDAQKRDKRSKAAAAGKHEPWRGRGGLNVHDEGA